MENTNHLEWKVTDENQFDRYEIERSFDAKSFVGIGIVKAKSNGESGVSSYDFTDQTSQTGNFQTIYYRLKMIDQASDGLDGSYAYSRLVAIGWETGGPVGVYPNPAVEAIHVSVDAALLNTKANVYDLGGLLVKTIWITKNDQQVNLTNMANGMYMITFENGSVMRFVKE